MKKWPSENLTITFPNVKPMNDIHKYVLQRRTQLVAEDSFMCDGLEHSHKRQITVTT